MDLPHLSASSLKTWGTCKLQFYADKVLQVPRQEPHELTKMGSAVHYAFERSENKDAISKIPETCEELELTEELSELATTLTQTCEDWGWGEGIDELDHCISEQEFLIDIGEGVKLKGFIDRLDIKGNQATILDIKTQSKKFTEEELRKNLQADIYNLAARKLFPQIQGVISVEFWVLRHEIQSVNRTEKDAEETANRLREQGAKMLAWDSDKHPDASAGNHCKWCNYLDQCPEWN